MQDFNFELFERLKDKVLKGEATLDEYNLYKDMNLQKEEVVKEISEIEKEISEIDIEIRQLRKKKEELLTKLNTFSKYFGKTQKYLRIGEKEYKPNSLQRLQKDKAFSDIGWYRENSKVYVEKRVNKTGRIYRHDCPILHFQTITNTFLDLSEKKDVISIFDIEIELKDIDLGDGVKYRESIRYRIAVALSILEQEGLIKWAEKRRPYRFFLERNESEIKEWFKNKIIEPWIKELYKFENYKEILNLEKKILQNETIKGIILAVKAKI